MASNSGRRLCGENNPDSLWSICLDHCTRNPQHIFVTTPDGYTLRGDDSLPRVVCESLLKNSAEFPREKILDLLHVFRDNSRTDLKIIDLRCVDSITDDIVLSVLKHRPIELSVSSEELTPATIQSLNEYGSNLRTLQLGVSSGMFGVDEEDEEIMRDVSGCDVINLPNLKVFGINSLPLMTHSGDVLRPSLLTMTQLVRLDLSDCQILLQDVESAFRRFTCLREINLSNVDLEPLHENLHIISLVKTLRAVDLSQSLSEGQRKSYCGDVDAEMSQFLTSLPQLVWLDIAGTNLAGVLPLYPISHRPGCDNKDPPSALPWNSKEKRVFEYLGLLNCVDNPCDRENIPAKQIAGDASEEQTLLSIKSYTHKRELLLTALNNLFHIFKFGECVEHKQALEGIISAMKAYVSDKAVQISGSASLFYVVKGELRHQLTTSMKKKLLNIILNAMESHLDEPTMLRNGCLTLCHFQLPQDVMHCYARLVCLLHRVALMRLPESENFVQRISIYLLNSLACQVDTSEKLLIGELGAFSVDASEKLLIGELEAVFTMLRIIQERAAQGECDEVMEVAWSMMWNVTDETAKNSERFMDGGGMEIFLDCLNKFPKKEELLRNMMGLMGNVAEVDYLRPRLMESVYLSIFSDLLSSDSDGIEVSYNACGVLANIMSDGEESWTLATPTRREVLDEMRRAISRWKLNTKRNINYRSFKPILLLLDVNDTPEVQHWAVWALCNLTKMYKSKYCTLLESEGGLEQLSRLMSNTRPYLEIKQLANQVVSRCHRFKADPAHLSDDDMEEESEN